MPESMIALDGGEFTMGSDRFYREESPAHRVRVAPFQLDTYAVTNRQFADFVHDTGYVTTAERPVDAESLPYDLVDSTPASLVFRPTAGPVDLRFWKQWWAMVPGANWRHPRGPNSDISDLMDHPVVQVSYYDASAFAAWCGKRLPTEAEWEFAARGGLHGATYAWGEEPNTAGAPFANTWQGLFPYQNDGARGWIYTCPVGAFPPNGYGLYEMTGNTWEWTSSPWSDNHSAEAPAACGCGPQGKPQMPARVTKGGSHLCSPSYCLRYRPAARASQDEDSATTHLGFRCAR